MKPLTVSNHITSLIKEVWWLFKVSIESFFHSYGDVTIADEGLKNIGIWCDTGPFAVSSLTTREGLMRTYSNFWSPWINTRNFGYHVTSVLYGIWWAHLVIGINSATDSELVMWWLFEAGKWTLVILRTKSEVNISIFIKENVLHVLFSVEINKARAMLLLKRLSYW